jgi:hypothetical protein
MTGLELLENYEPFVDFASAALGMDMPKGPGKRMSEVTFLGGGFASTDNMYVDDPAFECSNYAWVSLGVIKAMYMPSNVFTGTLESQAKQWAKIVSKCLGGNPAAKAFQIIGSSLNANETANVEEYLERHEYDLKHKLSSMHYCVSWGAWANMLQDLCAVRGFDETSNISDLVEEFQKKANQIFPDLNFTSSWEPLFISRFGKRPVRFSSVDDGNN